MRTAKAWNKEPLRLVIGSFHEFEPRVEEGLNNLLMLASQMVEDETCSSCGTPYWLGKSTINYVEFDIKESACYSCAELETEREKSKKKAHGITKYIVPKASEGFELPSREESYRKMSSNG